MKVATWNIRSGRNGGLETAVRALHGLEVDVAVLQETRLTKGVYARKVEEYRVMASDAGRPQGG